MSQTIAQVIWQSRQDPTSLKFLCDPERHASYRMKFCLLKTQRDFGKIRTKILCGYQGQKANIPNMKMTPWKTEIRMQYSNLNVKDYIQYTRCLCMLDLWTSNLPRDLEILPSSTPTSTWVKSSINFVLVHPPTTHPPGLVVKSFNFNSKFNSNCNYNF